MMRHPPSHTPACSSTEQRSGHAEEQGAILILLVILSVALLVITGLAIDTGLMAASRAQHRQTSELLALRALREYISSTDDGPANKLMDARDKAQALLGIEVFLGQPFRAEPGLGDEIGPLNSSAPSVAGPSGRIVPGIWHFRPEIDPTTGACVGATPCPCTTGAEFAGACFEPIDFNDAANFYTDADGKQKLVREVNAIRAELRLRDESPLKTVFARVSGGDPTYTLESTSTAAVFPSHAMFLLPLTRYAHMETHIPYERADWTTNGANNNPSESAYHLLPPKLTSCLANRGNPCKRVVNTALSPPYENNCEFEGGLFPGLYSTEYVYGAGASTQLMKNTRAAPGDFATKRSKNDYGCYAVNYMEDGVAKSESYLVDTYRGAVGGPEVPPVPYVGPQPLTSYLSTLNYALNLIYQRNIPGDRIGLLAFDQSTTIDKRRILPATTDSSDFRKLLRVTDTDITGAPLNAAAAHDSDYDTLHDSPANRLIERIEQTMLFVRADGQANLPAALDQARLMLINDTPNPSLVENRVVLLGNGISNCLSNGTCGRDQNTFVVPSLNESVDFVNQYYVPDNIRFDMISAGDMLQPHTMVRRGNTAATANACMSEQETKEFSLSYVDSGPDPLPNATNPSGYPGLIGPAILNSPASYFYFPNRIYDAVSASRGVWFPLRKPCTPSAQLGLGGGLTCAQGGLKTSLDQKCAAEPSGGDIVTSIPNVIDGSGRMICDIYCRTREEQGKAAIDQIFSRSPFVLVE